MAIIASRSAGHSFNRILHLLVPQSPRTLLRTRIMQMRWRCCSFERLSSAKNIIRKRDERFCNAIDNVQISIARGVFYCRDLTVVAWQQLEPVANERVLTQSRTVSCRNPVLEQFRDMKFARRIFTGRRNFNLFLKVTRSYRICVLIFLCVDAFIFQLTINRSICHEWTSKFIELEQITLLLKNYYFDISVAIRTVLFIVDIAIVFRIRQKYSYGERAVDLAAEQLMVRRVAIRRAICRHA